jgi:hypothetical protein
VTKLCVCLTIILVSTFAAGGAAAEDIFLTCKIRLPNSERSFISQFDINEKRVVGDGTNITKDVKLTATEISFRVDNYLLGFITEVKIDRASGNYIEQRSQRKTLTPLNEWHGTCANAEKPAFRRF